MLARNAREISMISDLLCQSETVGFDRSEHFSLAWYTAFIFSIPISLQHIFLRQRQHSFMVPQNNCGVFYSAAFLSFIFILSLLICSFIAFSNLLFLLLTASFQILLFTKNYSTIPQYPYYYYYYRQLVILVFVLSLCQYFKEFFTKPVSDAHIFQYGPVLRTLLWLCLFMP